MNSITIDNRKYVNAETLEKIHKFMGNRGFSRGMISQKVKLGYLQQHNFEGYLDAKNHLVNFYEVENAKELQILSDLETNPDKVAAMSSVTMVDGFGENKVINVQESADSFLYLLQNLRTNEVAKDAEIAALKTEITANEELLKAVHEELVELRATSEIADKTIEEFVAKELKLLDDNSKLLQECERLRAEQSSNQDKFNELHQNMVQEMKKQADGYVDLLNKKSEELSEVRGRLVVKNGEYASLEKENAKNIEEIKQITKDLHTTIDDYNKISLDYNNLITQKAIVDQEKKALVAQIAELSKVGDVMAELAAMKVEFAKSFEFLNSVHSIKSDTLSSSKPQYFVVLAKNNQSSNQLQEAISELMKSYKNIMIDDVEDFFITVRTEVDKLNMQSSCKEEFVKLTEFPAEDLHTITIGEKFQLTIRKVAA